MKFEIVSKYADAGLALPERKTRASAGYDFQVAQDITVPSYFNLVRVLKQQGENENEWNHSSSLLTLTSPEYKSLSEVAAITKQTYCKPTLVPTGIKCKMPEDMYLELSVRSSCPLKHWLILANGVGIIDADYYNNPDNEGHIFFQIINLSPFDIMLRKGDIIGQGVFHKYYTVDDDTTEGERTGGFGSTDKIIPNEFSVYEAKTNEELFKYQVSEGMIEVYNSLGLAQPLFNNKEKLNDKYSSS